MKTDFKKIRDVSIGIFDGPHATPTLHDSGAAIFLGIREINEHGQIDTGAARWISEADYQKWTRRVEPRAGDIVFTYEATLNRYALIPEGLRCCLGRRTALLRPDPRRVNPRYLFAYLFSRAWRSQIEANTIPGATVDRIALTRFPDFLVEVPTREVQDRIAGVIAQYDDLLLNLGRQQQLLVEAKALLLPKLMSGQLDVSGIALPQAAHPEGVPLPC